MSLARQLPKRTVALVLAGGRGSRLQELTDRRAKPAVYFGGKFRIIDFALSNCINSGIRRIGVLTQYKSHSLLRHLQRGWNFLRGDANEFLDLLPAQQRINEADWYRGTADAIYQNIDILRSYGPEYLLVLAGDHIYKMDYSLMLLDHVESGAKCTVGCIEVPRMEATALGVMAIDDKRKITGFLEKPADPPAMPGKPDRALGSMGIYVFDAEYLYRLLEEDFADPASHRDFGKDVIPRLVREGLAVAHPLGLSSVPASTRADPYWRDVGTVDAFWAANLDLASNMPELNIYDRDWPVWTHQEQLPPAKFVPGENGRHGEIANVMVSGGCIVSGSDLTHAVLFSSVRVHSDCSIRESVILPGCSIGRGCRLTKVVLDRGCELPDGMVIGEDPQLDAQRFARTDNGVVLVTQCMLDGL
ncbi:MULTISPECIES: glucose-1-phosphate adenylyltransferase [Ramlibacter]|uniref:Glucose-1-phosphate adenylyltransferase n=1 Tax=Ramlibacter pinisoli TaxID=2682844 RepID=A0A6N8IQL7_9BURK|nr:MULTISPECIES: glucose-1-phosphate adenylyltransferase [Ramlibacter]MBA2964215.1 glucose-1-phosphate adenylyltransferase [Ramlibacter sp. CGMCC 1.13660]MVQ29181.1 glucose-1-phosphate adenylyltransferase [Ramlibacter pinisoli]